MNVYEFAPVRFLLQCANWLLTELSAVFATVLPSGSAALAVVVLTLLVRACLIPVGRSQARATVTRQRLAPQLAELQRRYQHRPEELQRRTMQLYRDEKASPFAGCLPVLAQMPVLMAVYGLFVLPSIGGQPNALLDHTLWGVPLSTQYLPSLMRGDASITVTLVTLGIAAVIACVALLSRRLIATPIPGATETNAPKGAVPGVPNLASATRVLSYLPLMTAVIALFVPLAAGLYLVTTTTWSLGERLILNRIYGVGRTGGTPAGSVHA